MKCPVAFLSVATSVVLLAATVPAQNTRKGKAKERARASPRSATIEICQGVPIRGGYPVIAYKTSSACPHGAYVLKKQEAESQSTVATTRVVQTSASASTAVSRPRRVRTQQPETDLDSLSGAPTQPLGQPPTMAGMTPIATSVSTPTRTVPVSEPEEVSEGDVVRVDTTLVTVPVSVLDRQGRFVPNLRREDFSVFENGIEQPIAYFEPAEKPFTVALILDTSASTHFHLWEIKEAAIAFAKQLRPQDRVLVVTFNDEVLLLTEATNDSDVVSLVIQQNATAGDSTRLYDAVDLVIKERLNKIKGRKAIVLFTDGVDTSSYLPDYQSTLREVEDLDAT